MATDPPLNSFTLGAYSVADDLGYVALYDLAQALDGVTSDYRVIGGHMVTMLAARWQLGAGLYRETGDVDLGTGCVKPASWTGRTHHRREHPGRGLGVADGQGDAGPCPRVVGHGPAGLSRPASRSLQTR
jgi:hypothetical protein